MAQQLQPPVFSDYAYKPRFPISVQPDGGFGLDLLHDEVPFQDRGKHVFEAYNRRSGDEGTRTIEEERFQ